MKLSSFPQKKQPNLSDFLKNLSVRGIDAVIILFFVTTGLTSADTSQYILLITAISVIILLALIMGISSFIAARQERNHFFMLGNKDLQEAEDLKEQRLLENLGITVEVQNLAQEEIDKDRKNWQNLMVQLNNNQNKTGEISPLKNAVVTGVSYTFGGIIPLAAYFFTSKTSVALQYSGIISLTVLFILGFLKSSYLKRPLIDGAVLSLFSGAFAGIAGYFIAKLFIQVL